MNAPPTDEDLGAPPADPDMGRDMMREEVDAGPLAQDMKPDAPTYEIVFPVEVMGPQGTTKAITFAVDGADGADAIYLQGHALNYQKSALADQQGYDKKGAFRVNGGAWIPIDNETASFPAFEVAYKGIGGPLHTLRMELPAEGIQDGENTVEFRFNGTEGISVGWRVLDFDVRDAQDASLLSDTTRRQEDPNAWTPPLPEQADIDAGEVLWHRRESLVDSPMPGAPPIGASCADCHASDGRDLTYFNYSNESIVARSTFHGLTETQGNQIASYIRSIDLELPQDVRVADLGRPWNPPYQPGPGLDDRPIETWSAGAGLEWVLDEDRDMLPYLFPDGTDLADAMPYVDPEATVNFREIPIALQLPDWNHWLPQVYPGDVLGMETFHTSDVYQRIGVDAPMRLQTERQALIDEARQWVETQGDSVRRDLFRLFGAHSGYQFRDSLNFPSSEYPADPKWSGDEKRDDISFHQWMTVKAWEFHQVYKLEDVAPQIFTEPDAGIKAGGNDRAWIIHTSSVFNVGPHKNSRPQYPHDSPYGTPAKNQYFTTAWYELQALLTLNRVQDGTSNVDWNYHHPHIGEVASLYNHNQTLRWLKSQIAVQQHRTNGFPFFGRNNRAWYWEWHTVDPARLLIGYKWSGITTDYPDQQELTKITAAVLNAWLISAERFTPQQYFTGDRKGDLETPQYVPQDDGGLPNMAGSKPDSFLKLVARLSERGADPGVVDRAARFGESMWPGADWEQYYQ